MNEILLNILSVVVTSIILPLLTYAGTRLIAYLNSKIKDENYRIQLTTAYVSKGRIIDVTTTDKMFNTISFILMSSVFWNII